MCKDRFEEEKELGRTLTPRQAAAEKKLAEKWPHQAALLKVARS